MPVIQPPPISKQLRDEIHKGEKMHDFISGTLPDKFVGATDQKILVAAIYSLTSEHHAALLYLLKAARYDGSALALVRPLIDGAYRAHWIYSCEKPDIVARNKNGENVYPGLINMADKIEMKVNTDGLFATIKPYINTLHGYTHALTFEARPASNGICDRSAQVFFAKTPPSTSVRPCHKTNGCPVLSSATAILK